MSRVCWLSSFPTYKLALLFLEFEHVFHGLGFLAAGGPWLCIHSGPEPVRGESAVSTHRSVSVCPWTRPAQWRREDTVAALWPSLLYHPLTLQARGDLRTARTLAV